MLCPKCGARAYITESRLRKNKDYLYRRHHCPECGFRFSTHEIYAKDYSKPIAKIKWRGAHGSMGIV